MGCCFSWLRGGPRSVAELVGRKPLEFTWAPVSKEGLAKSQAFRPSSGDVFISTYPKTGTTWMQQIVHQLRTGGHTDFEEISEEGVVPWLELGPSLGIDLMLPQTAGPRCFKTHQTLSRLSHLEPGGRFLCVIRSVEATLLSYFKFAFCYEDPAAVETRDVNKFIRTAFILGPREGTLAQYPAEFGANIWEFYAEYWQCRQLPSVKIVAYENLRKNLSAELDGINAFLGLPSLDEQRRGKVLELSSMQWMSSHDSQFDDHTIGQRLADVGRGEVQIEGVAKVALDIKDAGIVTELNTESKAFLTEMWRKHLEPVTGCKSYEEMVSRL